MHGAASSRRGCSQVLFLGILSRHVHSIALRLLQRATWGGFALILRLDHKGKVVALRLHRRKSDASMNRLKEFLIFLVHKPRVSEQLGIGQQIGVRHFSTRPYQTAIYTRWASPIPRRLLDVVMTGDDKTIKT